MTVSFENCAEDTMVVRISVDVKKVKGIVEDSKLHGWTSHFQYGFRLIQDV